jgi:prepilin-type N-terminal cleavage/methylation domain-containing protein
MKNIFKNRAGFTVMEIIIAVGIFGIAVTAAIGIFVMSNKAQKKVSDAQKVSTDIRYILEVISREIRLGTVDFGYYNNSPTGTQAVLALQDSSSLWRCFRRRISGTQGIVQAYVGGNRCVNTEAATGWNDISSTNISVEKLNFFIFPKQATTTQQSLVTITMGVKSLISESGIYNTSNLETSVATRSYRN